MNPDIRNQLKPKILNVQEEYGLEGILIESYIRQIDNKTQISSSDMAYILTSILESPTKVKNNYLNSNGNI